MLMKVLIVDDDSSPRQTLRDTLEEHKQDCWEVEDQGFDGLSEALERFRPDMLVLDLVDDQDPDPQAAGNSSFKEIRDTWFCPVVVYSAFPDQQNFQHPLVTTVTKGANTDLEVRDHLRKFVAQAKGIQSVHEYFDAHIREALYDSFDALQTQVGTTGHEEVRLRAVRRLVAARADAETLQAGKLRAWERFVVPPLGDHLLTADLLRRAGAEWNEEEAYRLVLTPSCDLAARSGGRPSADRILVACCERVNRLGKIEFRTGESLNSNQKSIVRSILTEGMVGHHIPIPEFRGNVPWMAANLKRLELLEWDQVDLQTGDGHESPEDSRFHRVASTDSPFREMVVWAYLRVTGRPGLPVIDIDDWLESISDHFAAGGDS